MGRGKGQGGRRVPAAALTHVAPAVPPAGPGHRGAEGAAARLPAVAATCARWESSLGDPVPQVVTEILISILASNNRLLRGVAGSVFR